MKKWLVLSIYLAVTGTGQAQFFGGYGDGVTSVETLNNGSVLQIVYDDFTFDLAGDINFFGLVGMFNLDQGSTSRIYFEIRTGMSPGNGGTLLFSGLTPSVSFAPYPTDGSFGTPPPGPGTYGELVADIPNASAIHLEAGTYWIGLAPLSGFGHYDVTSTQGSGAYGHPINNGNAFYYDNTGAATFVSLGANDFGLRVGTVQNTNIPEPTTTALLGFGMLGLISWRKR